MKVGLTGGIGSGKSFVARLLCEKGFSVFDCDGQAKQMMVEDDEVVRLISDVVGDDAYLYDDGGGSLNCGLQSESKDGPSSPRRLLNKKAVAAFLFKSQENASVINDIVHPRLANVFKKWADSYAGQLVFMESAILFESGFNNLVDRTVCVVADEHIRIQRAMDRDAASYKYIVRRIRLQDNQEKNILRADYILYNNEGDNISDQIDKLILALMSEQERFDKRT